MPLRELGGRAQLGEVLVHLGVITEEQLQQAMPTVTQGETNLLAVLAEKGFADEEKLLKAVSVIQKIPYFTSFEGMIDMETAKLVPQRMARKLLAIPLQKTKKGILLGMVNSIDIIAIDTIASHTGQRVFPVLTTRRNLFETITKVWGDEPMIAPPSAEEAAADAVADALAGGDEGKTSSLKIVPRDVDVSARFNPSDNSVIEIVDGIIADGVASGASDIHLEPTVSTLRSRLRVDGILHDRRVYHKDLEAAIVARIKILSRLDITETRLPQDGHISVDYGGRGVDLRISSLPTIYGEKVVIRILDQLTGRKSLADMGMAPEILASFSKIIHAPMGLVLVTGPTGSGKTSTLYAAINAINTQDRNIITLEDPVEYRVAGINQVETNSHIGLTFATGLRAILRQDPNVILVGEIRDLETGEIAVQASITGHLVLSTLHTKDAVGAIGRLLNMNIEPFLLSAALSGVMAQRLLRVLCNKCKREEMPAQHELTRLGIALRENGPFFVPSPAGCESCMGLGYVGRRPIHEWLAVDRHIRDLITAAVTADTIKEAAKAAGLKTLQESGLELVYKGVTSIAEVIRVTYEDDTPGGAAH